MKILIARYNENIAWAKPFLRNVIIYNKGLPLDADYRATQLQNVGREGHTYYTYIYENYDNLDDYTMFLQGNPFDHSPNIIDDITKYMNVKDIEFDFIDLGIKRNDDLSKGHGPMIDVYEKLFGERKLSMPLVFGPGAQFMVSKKKILSRPRDFYLKVVKLLDYDISPMEGFVIERLHHVIFA